MKYIEYIKAAITAMHNAAAILNDHGYAGDAVVGPIKDVLTDYGRLVRGYNIPDLATLETLLKANAEGRVVVLPCKPQSLIYQVHQYEVLEWLVTGFSIDISGALVVECHDEKTEIDTVFWPGDFGKTVLLTCQEAEAALEEEKRA